MRSVGVVEVAVDAFCAESIEDLTAGEVLTVLARLEVFSDLRVLGQIGTTIGLGLLFDTLVVRSFLTPAIATMLGRWFWWPINIRTRPAPKPFGPKPTGADDTTGPIPVSG